MADFENFEQTAANVVKEIERKLVALGVDWRNEARLRELAREALTFHVTTQIALPDPTRHELFGLIGLMLRTMEEGAQAGREIHGNECWKALARALWAEKEADITDFEARR